MVVGQRPVCDPVAQRGSQERVERTHSKPLIETEQQITAKWLCWVVINTDSLVSFMTWLVIVGSCV